MKTTYAIGDLYTSTKSGVTGIIKEIEVISSSLVKVRLDVNGVERWTTWTPTTK